MATPNYTISLTANQVGASSVSPGQCLVIDPTGTFYQLANSTNRGTRKSSGISLGTAPAYGATLMQTVGDCPTSVTGLAAGTASPLRVSTAGVLERIASPSASDDVVGYCETDGTAHLFFGGIVAALGGTAATMRSTANHRLTLTTSVPVTTSDVTGAPNLFLTPYTGNQIGLYYSAAWLVVDTAEVGLSLGTLTSGKNYDVFAYYTGSAVALELSAAWLNDLARTDALSTQDGIVVKGSDPTRRHVGTFRTTATTTTEDSQAKRFLWNRYNQVVRASKNTTETTDSWVYNTNTIRQSNGNTANQFEYVTGDATSLVRAEALTLCNIASGGGASPALIGVDSTTTNSAQIFGGTSTTNIAALRATYKGYPGLGYHFITWLEVGPGAGTTTFYGDAGLPLRDQAGIVGELLQ